MDFTKLYERILRSSIWQESDHIRLVWITMLVLCDKDGDVLTSIPGLAHAARVPIDACVAALERLQEPDAFSTTPDNEGRRIEPIPGGFRVLNFRKYYAVQTKVQEREAAKKRSQRAKNVPPCPQMSPHVPICPPMSPSVRLDPDPDPDKDPDKDTNTDGSAVDVVEKTNHHELMEAWNQVANAKGYSPCPSMTKSRCESHNARIRDKFWRENWQKALTRLAAKGSKFLEGDNDRGWKANIEWFLKADTVPRIFEGRHDAKAEKPKPKVTLQEKNKEIEDECFRKWGRVINDSCTHQPLPADHPAYRAAQ